MKTSAEFFLYSARLIASYGLARLRHPRDPRLLMGNALIGRLLAAARRLGVAILTQAEVTDLVTEDGAVTGLVVTQGGTTRRIATTRGVVLASGGFTRHPKRRQEMLPAPAPEWSPAAPGHTGELHDIVLGLGAHYGTGQAQNAFWAPISVQQAQGRLDGRVPAFRPRPLEARHLLRRPRRPPLRQRVALLPRVRRRDVRRQPRTARPSPPSSSPTASR